MIGTTRGDNQIDKPIFAGIKKACLYNLEKEFEFVFDHGYAGDTYGLEDLIAIFNATTANVSPGSEYENWSGPCKIDMIISQRLSDPIKLLNSTQTLKSEKEQFVEGKGRCTY